MEAALSGIGTFGKAIGRAAIDFALPPRCPGCGDITAEVDLFCTGCWGQLQFLESGCDGCGVPLAHGGAGTCEACLAATGPLARSRAALAYGDIPRAIATRLKYGRKIALARTMARMMKRPLAELSPGALLVPVPLHRWRLWRRGSRPSARLAAHPEADRRIR